MEVVDHVPHAWYLLEEGPALLLDVSCNHGAFGYTVLVELDDDERARLAREGRAYLDELSTAIHDSAPILDRGSPYRPRDLTKARGPEVSDAVRRWRERTG